MDGRAPRAGKRRAARWVGALLAAELVAGSVGRARASTCPVPVGADAALGAIDASERLAFLADGMHEAARRAKIWTYTWTGLHAAMGVGQLAILPIVPAETHVDRYLGSAASLVGIVSLLALPLRVIKDARVLDEKRAALAGGGDACALLAEAEQWVDRDAVNEARVHAWWPHTATMLFGAGLGLTLALGWKRYDQGAVIAVASMFIGELRLNTQPEDAAPLRERYRAAKLGGQRSVAAQKQWMVVPSVAPLPGGAAATVDVVGTF